MLGVLLFLFVLFFLVTTPEDIARRALGEKAPPEAIDAVDREPRLRPAARSGIPRRPADTLLVEHFRRMLTFDFGRSDADDVPIARRLREGVWPEPVAHACRSS